VLDALARRGALAVLTNKPIASTRRILEGLDLARFFPPETVLGGDGPFARKPDPRRCASHRRAGVPGQPRP
jgi:phosphoglycolate phosphatase-like HAD superfamily hydrolase